ncbi:MAG: bifunctional pyr operon transcriptional regulator/uracil phosphoribosyltransferase PyrR [Candidatus Neomarinimicrobiota bacterium]
MTIDQRVVMTTADIKRSLTRLAFEIVERNPQIEKLVMVGIQSRGEPLSRRLHGLLLKQNDWDLPIGSLDITFHRDDFRTRLVVPQVKATDISFSIDGKTVILVDDVLYTGRTVRAALDTLVSFGRPAAVQLAVLVDRGHREMPIKADYVGKNIPTHEGEHVAVRLKEIDGEDGVLLTSYKEAQ